MSLSQRKCVPCEAGTLPMPTQEAEKLLLQVSGWQLLQVKAADTIEKKFRFKDFAEAMKFVNKVAAVAEEEGHHPDITINWNKVTLQLSTHAIKGLSENDFIMAAKVDKLT